MVENFVGVSAGHTLVREELAFVKAPVDGVVWGRSAIVFSACNEDSACEIEALGPIAGKRVFAVTAGGGRVLNLLPGRPAEICAVDLNPTQNALLELKIGALRALDHPDYLAFLGVTPSDDRLATYERLRPDLSPAARSFWDASPDLVTQGPLFAGKLERFFRRLAVVLRLGHPLGLDRLFSFSDIDEQRRYLARFDTFLWRSIARNVARRWVMRVFSGDPGFYRYVPADVPIHNTIYDRVHGYFQEHLARDNPLLQLVFFGRYVHPETMPIYLNAATFGRVKAALADVHIEIITSTVHDALEWAGPASFDAFSISDISSYLDDAAHEGLFSRVIGAARPGARLCSRSNLHHRALSTELARHIRRDAALERRFALDDHSCVHEFLVGEIV